MTVDEAIKRASTIPGKCWIIWNTNTCEIIDVIAVMPHDSIQDDFIKVSGLTRRYSPASCRRFDATSVTKELLAEILQESSRVRTRTEIFSEWACAPVDDLMVILERGIYEPPATVQDSSSIIEHLWKGHRDELTADIQTRLKLLISTDNLTGQRLDDDIARELNIILAALTMNERELKAVWFDTLVRGLCPMMNHLLLDAFAFVNTRDKEVISYAISRIETAIMFGAGIHQSITLLGRLGNIGQTTASETIRRVVYDSEPWIIKLRERVLDRIESPHTEWTKCQKCCYGAVHVPDSLWTRICWECSGLGVVRITSIEVSN